MNTATNNIEEKVLTLGEQFRQAREALNLSIEDVSKKISLRPSILQLIETNQLAHKSIPATFMRGYVRSYAKFLKLPESVWVHASFGEDHKNDLGKNARATRAVNHYSSHNHWIGWLSLLVVLIVAGMTGLWWWENYTQSNAERESLVQHYVDTTPQSSVVQSTPIASSTVLTDTTQNATVLSASSVAIPTTQTTSSTDLPVTISPVSDQPITSADVLKAEMEKLDEKSEKNLLLHETVATPSHELHIEVTGGCWISVQNESGKILAQKEYKQGDVLTFNEGVTYSLIIGAPANVKITYKGEDYPLKVDGRVARFKLPQ
ncbi:RodZ domain-containing protein [Pasteurella multocida]|uniref:RodZ domain-containing protein n=1 Tax=Pasteurella multocida TaxID=747 RepID=UPI002340D8FA|nr:RodZ family helix-turn-helix domain-containing protein [Pasteurella multocida]MDC4236645.1 helix-turn-helix domain-containing protein [Pasteurella multocida]HDV7288074.1 helix-turn-helix domain-containing protein [Pasteurella multocida]